MQLPRRHRYDLYLRSMSSDAVVFGGRSRLYAVSLCGISTLLLGLYAGGVWRMPFENLGVAAHLLVLGGALLFGLCALGMALRREQLTLRRGQDGAAYQLALGPRRYHWQAPLSAFSAVSAEIIAETDGKAVGRRHWAFYLDRWDGKRVRFSATPFGPLPASKADHAERLARSIAAFLHCEVRVADGTRIDRINEPDRVASAVHPA